MGVARSLSFCCLAFHPSSLPLPLFWSWSGTLTTSLYTPFLPPIPPLSSGLSLPSLASLSFLPHTTAHNLCHPLVSPFTLSLCLPTTRLRRLTRTLADIRNLQTTTLSFTPTPGVQVCVEHSFSRFSNHTVLVSWHPLDPSTLHAACRSTIICCARVTNV